MRHSERVSIQKSAERQRLRSNGPGWVNTYSWHPLIRIPKKFRFGKFDSFDNLTKFDIWQFRNSQWSNTLHGRAKFNRNEKLVRHVRASNYGKRIQNWMNNSNWNWEKADKNSEKFFSAKMIHWSSAYYFEWKGQENLIEISCTTRHVKNDERSETIAFHCYQTPHRIQIRIHRGSLCVFDECIFSSSLNHG